MSRVPVYNNWIDGITVSIKNTFLHWREEENKAVKRFSSYHARKPHHLRDCVNTPLSRASPLRDDVDSAFSPLAGNDDGSTMSTDRTCVTLPVRDSVSVQTSPMSVLDAHVTTVIVRKLSRPMDLTACVAALNKHGFANTYDFVHVPTRMDGTKSARMVFVNFYTPSHAQMFVNHCHDAKSDFRPKNGNPHISPSHEQGADLNIQRIRTMLKRKKGKTNTSACFLNGQIVFL